MQSYAMNVNDARASASWMYSHANDTRWHDNGNPVTTVQDRDKHSFYLLCGKTSPDSVAAAESPFDVSVTCAVSRNRFCAVPLRMISSSKHRYLPIVILHTIGRARACGSMPSTVIHCAIPEHVCVLSYLDVALASFSTRFMRSDNNHEHSGSQLGIHIYIIRITYRSNAILTNHLISMIVTYS